ncbi:FeoA family protein [Desulfofundulus thermosubterraneus]|uniref:Ferrous iron transport protein A n=1 Tax=Desulfofundulus thermosubterraneus DSM 16057 TaxID=1121432 RepID=A0A1M6JT92_9FIRM|nr:FeoA family protein [Desulfofundulus thermosubterraneus]SHJ49876.1 ferrous iron transport protein A [Desulfofundulus thermosubterraneus DSM 16057]
MNESSGIKLLGELAQGIRGRVVRINAQGSLRRRILTMGLVPGVEIIVQGRAPLGDPMEIVVRGFRLTLRKEEANGVAVEVF